ncbi:hypothetical protein [Metabacillus halosaccharovorans]|uniref:hypothetical protein n=1 Tax=Metabacillus halosaccharovorans TaxID=930124 RepID=UPI001C1FC45B|nr:hypothetical protein [Metabacillus halosaccharovorans]
MKSLMLAILGAIVTCLVMSLFTQELEINYLVPLIIGIVMVRGLEKEKMHLQIELFF